MRRPAEGVNIIIFKKGILICSNNKCHPLPWQNKRQTQKRYSWGERCFGGGTNSKGLSVNKQKRYNLTSAATRKPFAQTKTQRKTNRARGRHLGKATGQGGAPKYVLILVLFENYVGVKLNFACRRPLRTLLRHCLPRGGGAPPLAPAGAVQPPPLLAACCPLLLPAVACSNPAPAVALALLLCAACCGCASAALLLRYDNNRQHEGVVNNSSWHKSVDSTGQVSSDHMERDTPLAHAYSHTASEQTSHANASIPPRCPNLVFRGEASAYWQATTRDTTRGLNKHTRGRHSVEKRGAARSTTKRL